MSNNQNQGASIEAALLPCAMCGGTAHLTKGYATENVWSYGEFHRVFCGACQIRQLFHRTAAEAIAAWNRRTPAATTGDGELPPLPEPIMGLWSEGIRKAWAEKMRAYGQECARAAIEVMRAQRDAELIEWRRLRDPATLFVSLLRGEPARLPARELLNIAGYDQHVVDEALADRAQLAANGQGGPIGWLYDWIHSSALGKPDEHFTSFTADKSYAFKSGHENQRLVYAAPASAQPAVKLTRDDSGMCEVSLEIDGAWVPVIRDNGDFISHIVEPVGVRIAQQRARMAERFANRPRTAATADFDLPAPNDEIGAQPDQRESAAEAPDVQTLNTSQFDVQKLAKVERNTASPAAQPAKDEQK